MRGGRVSCIGPPGEVLPRVEEQLTGEKRQPEEKGGMKAEQEKNKGAAENGVILFMSLSVINIRPICQCVTVLLVLVSRASPLPLARETILVLGCKKSLHFAG